MSVLRGFTVVVVVVYIFSHFNQYIFKEFNKKITKKKEVVEPQQQALSKRSCREVKKNERRRKTLINGL